MSNKTILFADDSATMRTLMEKTFAAEPFEIVTVPSGEAAITKAREIRPALIIVDAGMAGVSGYDVCQVIREDADLSYTPVIITAGVSNPYDETRGRQIGVTEYVKKPFDTTQLIDRVTELTATSEPELPEESLEAEIELGEPIGAPPTIGMPSTRPTPPGGVPPAEPQVEPSTEAAQPRHPHGFGEPGEREAPQEQPVRVQPRTDERPKAEQQEMSSLRTGSLAEMAQVDARGEPISQQHREDAIDLGTPTPESEVTDDVEPIDLSRPARDTLQPGLEPEPEPEPEPVEAKPPVEHRISEAAREVAGGVDGLTPEQADAIRTLTAEVVERVVWEVVPDLAETIIKEKLEALLQE